MASYELVMYASTQSLVDEPTEYVKSTVINSNQSGTSVPENLISGITTSLKGRFNRLYAFTESKHPWGLPQYENLSVDLTDSPIEEIIEEETHSKVTIRSVSIEQNPWKNFGLYILESEGIPYIESIYGQVNIYENFPTEFPEDSIGALYSHGVFISDDVIDLKFVVSTDSNPAGEAVTIRYTNYTVRANSDYYEARYVLTNSFAGGETKGYKYWFYLIGSGEHPELDNYDATPASPLFPVFPIRYANKNIGADPTTELYKGNKLALKKVGLDFDELCVAVHGDPEMKNPGSVMYASIAKGGGLYDNYHYSTEEPFNLNVGTSALLLGELYSSTNDSDFIAWKKEALTRSEDINRYESNQGKLEDIDDIDNAMVLFGISVDSEHKNAAEYLYLFFDELKDKGAYTKSTYDDWVANENVGRAVGSNQIRLTTGGYDSSLNYYYIEEYSRYGQVGKAGEFSKTLIDYGTKKIHDITVNESELVLTYQVDTYNWKKLVVKGLTHKLYINDGEYKDTYVTTFSDQEDEERFANFIIPLSKTVLKRMKTFNEIDLYSDAFKLVIMSIEKVKLKWYQRAGFLEFIKIVGIIFSVFTLGKSLLLAESIKAALINVITQAAISYAVVEGVKLAIEIFGIEGAAAILAVIAVAAYQGKFEFIAEYSSTLANALPSAEDFLEMVSSVTNSFTKALGQIMSEEQAEYEADMNALKEELEELEEMEKELEKGYEVDPMALVRTSMNMFVGENAEKFYNRTIHSGNIGVLSLDTIRYYVDEKLKLPTTTDTLLGV